jgi:hypothetical protein
MAKTKWWPNNGSVLGWSLPAEIYHLKLDFSGFQMFTVVLSVQN